MGFNIPGSGLGVNGALLGLEREDSGTNQQFRLCADFNENGAGARFCKWKWRRRPFSRLNSPFAAQQPGQYFCTVSQMLPAWGFAPVFWVNIRTPL